MEKKECALCRRELGPSAPHVTLSVGLNPQGETELVEESHELDFCAVPSEHGPAGCAGKASQLLDVFVARLWDLRASDAGGSSSESDLSDGQAARVAAVFHAEGA